LLGTLLGEPVARADLIPRSSGFAGGLNLSGLQFLCCFSQAPGGVERLIGLSATSRALSAARIRLTGLLEATVTA